MITLHCRPPGTTATEIRIGRGLAAALPHWTAGRAVFALVDEAVAGRVTAPAHWRALAVRGGEESKTFAACERVLRAMAQAGTDRRSLLLAIGGGATLDLGGTCAALYARGIELWNVPTTLLAMVDGAIGGKTALNLPEGKNLAGTLWPAKLAVADVDFAASLPERELASGLAEVLKAAIGLDAELFSLLEAKRDRVLARDPETMIEVVRGAVAAKVAVVEDDPREDGRRRLLNLGHTLGHALEAHSGFALAHGLCVARGLWFALDLAEQLGALAAGDASRCRALLAAYGHRRDPLPPVAELLPFVARDKKVEHGAVHFALPTAIGRSEVRPLDLDAVAAALRAHADRSRS